MIARGLLTSQIPESIEQLIGPGLLRRLDRLDVISRKILAGKLPGERRSKRRGQGVEFDDYRPYVPGDDLRRIDWNVYARHDKFVLKLFRADEDLGVHILLDATRSMDAGDPPKSLLAHRLAMMFAYIGLVNQNRVTLSVLTDSPAGPQLVRLASMRGRQAVARAGSLLLASVAGKLDEPGVPVTRAPVQAVGDEPDTLGAALRAFAGSTSSGGVLFIISDFFEKAWLDPKRRDHALNALVASGGADPVLLQTLSPGELDPRLEADSGLAGDVRLTDIETGLGAEVTVSTALVRAYKKRLDAYLGSLETACSARAITHVMTPSDADAGELILGSLRRRGLVG